MTGIHKTALIDPDADVDSSVSIGAFSVVGPDVRIGAGTVIGNHVTLEGRVEIGSDNRIYHGCVIGADPQVKNMQPVNSGVTIGNGNEIREYVTVHRSFKNDQSTLIGDRNYLMAYTHVAHDCIIGNDVITANAVNLAGHVTVDDGAFIGGMTGFHQFTRVGRLAMIGGMSRIAKDVPPFSMVSGNPSVLSGMNAVGLKRSGLDSGELGSLKKAFNELFFGKGLFKERLKSLKSSDSDLVQMLCRFVESSERGVIVRG